MSWDLKAVCFDGADAWTPPLGVRSVVGARGLAGGAWQLVSGVGVAAWPGWPAPSAPAWRVSVSAGCGPGAGTVARAVAG